MSPRREDRTEPGGRAQATARLSQARKFLEVARLVEEAEGALPSSASVAASLAVLAGIAASDAAWKGLLDKPGIHRVDLPESDHTFSTRSWLQRVEEETLAWLKTLGTRQQTQ